MRKLALGRVEVDDVQELRTWPLHCAWDDLQNDLKKLYKKELHPPLLPIGTDGLTNYICVTLAGADAGSIVFLDHKTAKPSPLAPSLTAFLKGLRKRRRTDHWDQEAPAETESEKWFSNCGGWFPRHDLEELRKGIRTGCLNEQDEYGNTALSLAASSGWTEGVEELLKAGADTEIRDFREGETALHEAAQERNESIIRMLIRAGANADAANHWGITPRSILPSAFRGVARKEPKLPSPRIQNAEHLADHDPRFRIPLRSERETLRPGQAVNLYVFGPQSKTKQNTVKVRISSKRGRRPNVRYVGTIETPLEHTHLPNGTCEMEFGPEHVATVYVPRKK